MKTRIFTLLVLALIYLSSCQKDGALPAVKPVDSQSLTQLPGLNKDTTTGTGQVTPVAPQGVVTSIIQGAYLRVQLAKDPVNTDQVIIAFNPNASNAYVKTEDAITFQGMGQVSLSSLSSDNVSLAINQLPLPTQSCSIGLKLNAQTDGTYTLNMTTIAAMPAIFEIWLKDNYKKDSLDYRSNQSYTFDLVKADTNTYGSKRFSIVISQNKALGIHLLNFKAGQATGGAQVSWQVENEVNYSGFSVERSTDNGKTYTSLTSFTSSSIGNYSFLDKAPVTGKDQYRLKITDLNGTVTYSNIISLNF